MRKKITIIAGAVIAVAVLAGAGTALASIPDSSGVIHGCYTTKDGQGLRVIDSETGQTCTDKETGLNWNQKGPVGTQGVTGATGPQGPAGPVGATGPAGTSTAGPAGLDVEYIANSGTGSAAVICPGDHPYVLGGGGRSGTLPLDDKPIVGVVGQGVIAPPAPVTGFGTVTPEGDDNAGVRNGWQADGQGGDPVTVWAICAR